MLVLKVAFFISSLLLIISILLFISLSGFPPISYFLLPSALLLNLTH